MANNRDKSLELKNKFRCNNILFYIGDTIPITCDEMYCYNRLPKIDSECVDCGMKYYSIKKGGKIDAKSKIQRKIL